MKTKVPHSGQGLQITQYLLFYELNIKNDFDRFCFVLCFVAMKKQSLSYILRHKFLFISELFENCTIFMDKESCTIMNKQL